MDERTESHGYLFQNDGCHTAYPTRLSARAEIQYADGLLHREGGKRNQCGTAATVYRKLKAENDYAADSSRYLEIKKARFKEISKVNKSRRK